MGSSCIKISSYHSAIYTHLDFYWSYKIVLLKVPGIQNKYGLSLLAQDLSANRDYMRWCR